MTARPLKDIAASVHQRLLNRARESGRPFGELLQYYAIERFLYRLSGYSRENLIAEKFEIMVKRGEINSRMKDFYDIWLLARQFDFQGRILAGAIQRTFKRRGTKLPETMDPLIKALIEDETKEIQWRGFIRKSRLKNAPRSFARVIEDIKDFLDPVLKDFDLKSSPKKIWKAPGPWASA